MIPAELDDALLRALAAEHGTPLWVYSADEVRARLARLRGFDGVRYAQKASSNLALLRLVRAEGASVDAVSAGEVRRALAAGFEPRQICYTADLFEREALELVQDLPLTVNAGSPGMLETLAAVRPHAEVTLRVNPGFGSGHDDKVQTGGLLSKHGVWFEDLPRVVERARELELAVTGLHVHLGSGGQLEAMLRACDAMRWAARVVGEGLRTLSVGGGLPVPLHADEPEFDVERYARAWRRTRDEIAAELGRPLHLEVEPGRWVVASAGVLLTRVHATKQSRGLAFALCDAGFHTLARPALYGARHPLRAIPDGPSWERGAPRPARPTLVCGPLCESGDVFTLDEHGRPAPWDLPRLDEGDLVAIGVAGAYGASMSSTYNTRPLAAEVLVDGGRARLVRRRQRFEELLAPELDLLADEEEE